MQLGMTLPTMVGGLDRDGLHTWANRIDAGPYATLAVGERITYPNTEALVTLAAAAALTARVRIAYTVAVLPLHRPVQLAKQLATLDVLSGGRLDVGIGTGGRDEDCRAIDAPIDRRLASVAALADRLRRTWRGEPPHAGASPVGPTPTQPNGPPLFAGALMPKAIRRAAQWADGLLGFSFAPDPAEITQAFEQARQAWTAAGRPAPRLVTSCWFALGPTGRQQMDGYVTRYLNTFGTETAASMAQLCRVTSADGLRDIVRQVRDTGADELILVPTTTDVAELDRVADVLG